MELHRVAANYVYLSDHSAVFRDRKSWFEPLTSPGIGLWWMRNSMLPNVADAQDRLTYLVQHAPSPYAFTLEQTFLPPTDLPEATGVELSPPG